MELATYEEICAILANTPMASTSWADGLLTARMSLSAVERFLATMSQDVDSPLREAEELVLSKEIMRINSERGTVAAEGEGNGRMPVTLRAVLTPQERTRVTNLVSSFCQPNYATSRHRFGQNGHIVQNAARRASTSYLYSRFPKGASVLEVGPDVGNWIVSGVKEEWKNETNGMYRAARPVITPRDAVRVSWVRLAEIIEKNRSGLWREEVRDSVGVLRRSYDKIFMNRKIQDMTERAEYIISQDANYDVKFSDMPVAMMAAGARAWYGCMMRAKGLTRLTRLNEGHLDLMGMSYRVDWKANRIDFRNPSCASFGYSHNVLEYMEYEEHNGYVWSTKEADYVYSKAPESNAEMLFFCVVRVAKLTGLVEPRFTENPYAGMLEIQSVWAIGDEVSGVPTSFQPVKFYVDALNYWKVLEKRRAIDFKGNFSTTLALVKSTNVRMWLNGTPVGANKKISAKLAEATGVAVEVLAAEGRLYSDASFSEAMRHFSMTIKRDGFFLRMLEHVIDARMIMGKMTGPIVRSWESLRAGIIDTALAPLSDLCVSVAEVPAHVKLDNDVGFSVVSGKVSTGNNSLCKCAEVADVRMGLQTAVGDERTLLDKYLKSLLEHMPCAECNELIDKEIEATVLEDDCDEVSQDTTDVESCVSSVVELGPQWRSEESLTRPEFQSMEEFLHLSAYLMQADKVELRIDATKVFSGQISGKRMKELSTSRTEHAVLKFMSGRCVGHIGPLMEVGAVYDMKGDRVVPLRKKGNVLVGSLSNGEYYTCNRLRVWNRPELMAAVSYAMDYGQVTAQRERYEVVIGVPGAGKTYGMMQAVARYLDEPGHGGFFVLAVTHASVDAAIEYGVKFGIDRSILMSCVMTLHRYLMHVKAPTDLICFDEFPMEHIGLIDAAVSISGAETVKMFGDALQIKYDCFCAEYKMQHATLGRTVKPKNLKFIAESHRLTEDTCAMWLDVYPSIYPCDCCRPGEKSRSSLSVHRISNLSGVAYEDDVRYHTYKQDEKEELFSGKSMKGNLDMQRHRSVGGLSTVHEDQGSTHSRVHTVRTNVVYDKNAAKRNPSLYNRVSYVLTDTTRHTHEYRYSTMCAEDDLVCQRVKLACDADRLAMVRRKEGYGKVTLMSMLE